MIASKKQKVPDDNGELLVNIKEKLKLMIKKEVKRVITNGTIHMEILKCRITRVTI